MAVSFLNNLNTKDNCTFHEFNFLTILRSTLVDFEVYLDCQDFVTSGGYRRCFIVVVVVVVVLEQ